MNAGISGDTTSGGLQRLPWILKQNPRIVVVQLGANDGLRGLPTESTESNLRRIIEAVLNSGAKVLLLGMQVPTSYGEEYANAFTAIYPSLAADLKVAFVPFFMDGVAGHADLNLKDGIHPTARGHELLAENVQTALLELVRSLPDSGR
jgi:acyl-CoA thioesterase-1